MAKGIKSSKLHKNQPAAVEPAVELETEEKPRQKGGSNLYGGKRLIDVIEESKLAARERYQHVQELQRQEAERNTDVERANEKTAYKKIRELQEETRKLSYGIVIGYPRNETYIVSALQRICDVLDYLLEKEMVQS